MVHPALDEATGNAREEAQFVYYAQMGEYETKLPNSSRRNITERTLTEFDELAIEVRLNRELWSNP